ncbi:MAG: threonine--tRNA ligase [Patescibacteria group bacterium]
MNTEPIEHIRHSLAHLLGAAVLKLYPTAQITLGPAVDDGFYYDIDMAKVTEEDLPKIEAVMKNLLPIWDGFIARTVSADEAREIFAGNPYKLELIEGIVSRGEEITLYTSGDFTDLCRGGHVSSMKIIDPESFKITRIAGAYWRGDEKNKMLTRIYGLAFSTKDELDTYIFNLEEAKKRDHKKLGKEMGLFTFSELVGPGLPLWTPKGTILRELLNDYVMELRSKYGYQKVSIPHITKKELYQKSGHWDKYKDDLFKITTRENHEYVMKPMNCPHHTQIFDSQMRSYRDMPQRYCETTAVYRDEQSGELSGLSRVLCITQDDAHVFCRVNQIDEEIKSVWKIIFDFYSTFGFNQIVPRLSRRDPETPEKYLGDVKNWDIAEDTLKKVIESNVSKSIDGPGEAAFYGPKIDFMAKDAIGRNHQVATIQLDFVMPKRFELFCINEKGEKEDIVMLHVAIMGSIERFLSVMIEHYAGHFPVWLSPVQVKIIPIGERQAHFADAVYAKMKAAGIRVELDDSGDSLGKKVRASKTERIPYNLVIGDKEMEAELMALEGRDGKKDPVHLDQMIEELLKEIKDRV